MTQKFKVGAVVELKSGGQPMTVALVETIGVFCVWCDGKKFQMAVIQPDLLRECAAKKLSHHIGIDLTSCSTKELADRMRSQDFW